MNQDDESEMFNLCGLLVDDPNFIPFMLFLKNFRPFFLPFSCYTRGLISTVMFLVLGW
jgi:hypothetical protein